MTSRPFPTHADDTHSTSNTSSEHDAYGVDKREKMDDLERSTSGRTVAKTATGQAHIGEDEDPSIDFKTFMACLAISFLWTGSQVPLYMLLVTVDFYIAEIPGTATIQVWFILAPLTALAATAPVAGNIADLFGRRWSILGGGLFLIVGLIMFGAAQTAATIIVSLPLSGIGAGLLEINALAAVNEIAPNKLRGFYTSMLIWTIIPFFPLGIYALELAENVTWRWCIWIPLIWAGIGQVMTFFFYRPPPRRFHGKELSFSEKLARVDVLGVFLSLSGIVLFLVGLASGGYLAPWKSAQTLAPLLVGFLLLLALGYWETFARNPIFPPGMFKNTRVFTLTLVITAVAGANFFSILILWPKYILSTFYGQPTAYRGLLIMSQTVGTLFGAGFFSWTITRFKGSIRPQMAISCILMMAGLGGLYGVSETQPWAAGLCVFIGAVGVGGIIVPASVITQLCSPDEYLGTVTALTFVARVIGGAIGFTVYYYVLNDQVTKILTDFANNAASLETVQILLRAGLGQTQIISFLQAFAIGDVLTAKQFPGVTDAVIDAVSRSTRPVWAEAFQVVWIVTVAFSGVGLFCAVFMGDVSKYMTNHRAVHL